MNISGAAAYEIWGSGSGTKTSALGTVNMKKTKGGVGLNIKYTGVDMSQSMLDAAKIMTKDIMNNSVFYNRTAELVKRVIEDNDSKNRFDMAVISYTLSEVNPSLVFINIHSSITTN